MTTRAAVADTEPRRWQSSWTHALYEHATEAGLFDDRRIELIEGALYEMPPMNNPHIGATLYLEAQFGVLLASRRVRNGTPIRLSASSARRPRAADSQPEPDVTVVRSGAALKFQAMTCRRSRST